MKTNGKKLIALLGIMLAASAFATKYHDGLAYSTSKTLKTGVWNSHFVNLKAYAEKKGVPLIVLWANPGCRHCKELCQSISSSSAFTTWRKSSGYVFALGIGTSSADGSAAKAFAYDSSRQFPYCAVYLDPIGSASPVLKQTFTGNGMTASGFMSKVKKILKEYVLITVRTYGDGKASNVYYQKIGKTVTLKATPNAGSKFDGWYVNGKRVSTQATYKVKVSKVISYTAKFKKK